MNVYRNKLPLLSPRFDRPSGLGQPRRRMHPTLSSSELKQIVADMVG
ncbi:hypothetical protein [Sphingobium ummariense]|nr:hypothetical protein [Sphingobium ummariense]